MLVVGNIIAAILNGGVLFLLLIAPKRDDENKGIIASMDLLFLLNVVLAVCNIRIGV